MFENFILKYFQKILTPLIIGYVALGQVIKSPYLHLQVGRSNFSYRHRFLKGFQYIVVLKGRNSTNGGHRDHTYLCHSDIKKILPRVTYIRLCWITHTLSL